MRRMLVSIVWAAMLAGCGIILAPVSVPVTAVANHELKIEGIVVDEQGRHVPRGQLHIRSYTVIPNATVVEGEGAVMPFDSHDSDTVKRFVDGRISASTWATYLSVTISAEGFYPRTFTLDESGLSEDVLPLGRQKAYFLEEHIAISRRDLFQIVLERKQNPQKLEEARDWLDEETGGKVTALILSTDREHFAQTRREEAKAGAVPPGRMYLEVMRDPAGGFARAADGKKPQQMTLHLGMNGGFIRVPLEKGRAEGGRMRVAPETGYSPDLVLKPEDMGRAVRAIFYVKAGEFYGVGAIENLEWREDAKTRSGSVSMAVYLFLQPDGSRNVEQ